MTTSPRFAEIQIVGTDARAFLHSQLASDIRNIEPAQWRFGSYCAADGRVQALMLVASQATDHWRLLMPADPATAVVQRLQRYRLRARCSIECTEVTVEADEGRSSPAAARYQSPLFCWRVATGTAQPMAPALWAAQMQLAIPWLLATTSERFLPQMLALERLQAYSLRKGCFPGQEIVARTHYLGRSKRRLVRLAGSGNCAATEPGDELCTLASESAVGMLIATGTDACAGLAVVAENATVGMQIRPVGTQRSATFVIEGDVIETFSDDCLNGRYDPPSSA